MERIKANAMTDFNRNVSIDFIRELLKTYGYREQGENKKVYWYTPPGGEKNKASISLFKDSKKLFSYTDTDHFESNVNSEIKSYSPSDIFRRLECQGDTTETYEKLKNMGYGTNTGSRETNQATLYNTDDKKTVSPMTDFNKRGRILPILEKHGYEVSKADDKTYIIADTKEPRAIINGIFNTHRQKLAIRFTTRHFTEIKEYTKADVYTILEHNGNKAEAIKELIKLGYGTI